MEVGEGGATQEEAAEGGAAVETAWAPQDTEELLDAIATQDYGVSDDRSSKLTAPALKAYNKALKSEYGHYELRRGRTLPEGFAIVKVSKQTFFRTFSHLSLPLTPPPCLHLIMLAGAPGALAHTRTHFPPRGRDRSHAAHVDG